MSLATRCTSCGTVFRVVQDQLRVSDGWVRCGRCDAVFNASEGLFDLEREPPPAWSATQPPVETPDPAGTKNPIADDPPDGPPDWPGRSAHEQAFDGRPAAPAGPSPLPSGLIAAALARESTQIDAAPADASMPEDRDVGAEASLPFDAAEAPPDFVDRARRDAFWQRRRTRAALGAAAALLAVLLIGQAAAQFSDIAAARWTSARPVLTRWCSVAGCSVAAPRRIEEIVVDNSALAPVVGTQALKLGLVLRNRASFAVAVPSVDLSLTDSAGRLIARRALRPGDFRVTTASLAPGAEVALQAHLAVGAAAVTGYTVEIFYP